MEQNPKHAEKDGGSIMKTLRRAFSIRKSKKPKKEKGHVDQTVHRVSSISNPDRCLANNNAEIAVAGPSDTLKPPVVTLHKVATEPARQAADKVEIPLEDLDVYYKLNDGKKRIAVIFNHLKFDIIFNKKLPERKGTEMDGKRMKECLSKLGFDTSMYFDDPDLNTILKIIRTVSIMTASEVSCIVVVVMTHGDTKGILHARNCMYPKSSLTDPFIKSDTLVGVPKLFFLQACRGMNMDDGKTTEMDGDDDEDSIIRYKFPTHADFLMMYSTVDEHVSWREVHGTWFIQSLCEQLEKAAEPSYRWDLLQMLTFVNKNVAMFESNTYVPNDSTSIHSHQKKQIPLIETTMTKLLKFSAA